MMSQSGSESLTEQKFAAVLSTVKRANTDNEKFASLLIVSKLTKAENLADDKRRVLLKTIGFKFPTRLLSTACIKSIEESKDSIPYASIGASVLSLFCSDSELIQEKGIEESVSPLLKTIKMLSKNAENSNEIINEGLIALNGMTKNGKCMELLTSSAVLEILCNIRQPHKDQASQIVSALLANSPGYLEEQNNAKFLQNLVKNLKTEHGVTKFEACDQLSFVFDAIQPRHIDDVKPYLQDIIYGLEEILCSKITADQRKPALLLSAEVIRLVGISDFVVLSTKENFLVIVTRIACIEIGLLFRDIPEKDVLTNTNRLQLLMSSFAITEYFCSAIAQFEQNEGGEADLLTFEQIRLTQPALADMANSLTEYITEFLPQWRDISYNETLVLKSSIRMLGSWLNIENNATSAQGIETLPLVPKIVSFVTSAEDWELVKTTLPVIMISADSSEPLDVLLNHGILSELLDTLRTLTETPAENGELLTIVHLVIQTLLSIYSSRNFPDASDHYYIIRETFETVVKISEKPLRMVTCGYIYPVTAVLLKHMPTIEENSQNVIQDLIKFALDIHDISQTNGCLEVKESWKDVWAEISPLWEVCLQNIAECIRTKSFIKDIFMNSERYVLLSLFLEAAKVSKDGEVIELFFSLSEAVE